MTSPPRSATKNRSTSTAGVSAAVILSVSRDRVENSCRYASTMTDAMPARSDSTAGRTVRPFEQEGQLTDPGAVGGHPRQAVELVGADPPQRAVIVGVQRAAGLA